MKNQFLQNACSSNEGAIKYSTTGNKFIDNFASISKFLAPRTYEEVAADMYELWNIDPLLTVKLATYIRTITRKTKLVTKNDVKILDTQKGTGLRHEALMRFLWLAYNHRDTFMLNAEIFVSAGSWKDIFKMLVFDLNRNGWQNRKLDWDFFYNLIIAGLTNPETTHLVRKYMPTIRTNKNCKTEFAKAYTIIGRWIAKKMNPSMSLDSACKHYRKLKSEGTAHEWQQLISKQMFDAIKFETVAGKALSLLVGSKFLANHGLENKYREWISKRKEVKYTGFVFGMFKDLNQFTPDYVQQTINAQFATLIKEKIQSKLLVVRDISYSMTDKPKGCSMTSFDIAKAMALYFSTSLEGYFQNAFAVFNSECKIHYWKGQTPVDKWLNDKQYAMGSTDFQTVIDMFIDIKNRGVAESEFPEGILCLSDGEFSNEGTNGKSNFNTAIDRLREAGFSKDYVDNFKIILWDIPNTYYEDQTTKFEDPSPNFFYMSGFDPSIVSFLLEGKRPSNSEELFYAAMNQYLLNTICVF